MRKPSLPLLKSNTAIREDALMDRGIRRKMEAAMEKHAHACGICKKPFPSMSHTFGGMMPNSHFVMTCEACQHSLAICYVMGIYVPLDAAPKTQLDLFESHPHSQLVERPGAKVLH